MAFLRDDDALSMAVLAVCDALETTDATRADESITRARKHAHAVLARGRKRKQDNEPEITPAEGETDE